MGEDNTTLLLLAEGNGGPARSVCLRQASMLGAEDLVRIGGADLMFDGVVGGASQGKTSADGGDHVDLSLVRVRRGWYVAHVVVQLPFPDEPFNYVAQRNTRLGVMAAELMKAAEDPRVWHRLVGWSPGGWLGDDGGFTHQDVLIGGVEGRKNLEPGPGCEGKRGPITSLRRVASARVVVVAMSATFVIAEGMLVAILPFWLLGTLGTWGGGRMLRWG